MSQNQIIETYFGSMTVPKFVTSIESLATSIQWKNLVHARDDDFSKRYAIREAHIQHLGFPILTKESIENVARFIKKSKVADLGCGTGYLSAALRNIHSVDVTPFDSYETDYSMGKLNRFQYCDIVSSDMHSVDLTQFDGVILSWPDYGSDSAFRIASKLTKGQFLIYQGEGSGGCTADDNFHGIINSDDFKCLDDISDNINDYHVKFDGIHDHWEIFVRN